MGREIRRVPLDFVFPLDRSFGAAEREQHLMVCAYADDEDWDHYEGCGLKYLNVPTGEGWQLWQTVSDGPISPVFKTAEDLIDWMSQPDPGKGGYPDMPWAQGWKRETAERFVKRVGHIFSGMLTDHWLTTDEMVALTTEGEEAS